MCEPTLSRPEYSRANPRRTSPSSTPSSAGPASGDSSFDGGGEFPAAAASLAIRPLSRISSAVSVFFLYSGKSLLGTANILLTYAPTYAVSSLLHSNRSRSSLFLGSMVSSEISGYRIFGIRCCCEEEGGGIMSMTAWTVQVARGSHCEKTKLRVCRVFFDLRSRGRIFRFRALTIFSTFSGFLAVCAQLAMKIRRKNETRLLTDSSLRCHTPPIYCRERLGRREV